MHCGTKWPAWLYASVCVVLFALLLVCPCVKALSIHCGSQPTFHQFQNLLLPSTTIQIFVLFHLRPFSLKFRSPFLTACFFCQSQTKSMILSSAPYKARTQAWLSSTIGARHAMTSDHRHGSAD